MFLLQLTLVVAIVSAAILAWLLILSVSRSLSELTEWLLGTRQHYTY